MLKRGTALRITAEGDGANVPAIFYNFDCPVERYSMPDTLKAQHTAHLTKNFVLYSDMGRVLCSITQDTCGWHDLIGGHSTAAIIRDHYGSQRYQEHRNNLYRNTRDNFLIELANWGLGLRDLSANVNFFSKVQVDSSGAMTFVPGNSKAGDFVELRAEMNVLVVLDTGQHPLDPANAYSPVPHSSRGTQGRPGGRRRSLPDRMPGKQPRLCEHGSILSAVQDSNARTTNFQEFFCD